MADIKECDQILWKLTPNKKYWISEYGDAVHAQRGGVLKHDRYKGKTSRYLKAPEGALGYQTSMHRVVYTVFVGDIPEGLQINHIDGNKHNNHVSNLEVCTASENLLHAYRTGLAKPPCGEKQGSSKLKEEEVLQIYGLIDLGYNNSAIAKLYNIYSGHVSSIRSGHRWKYLFDREGRTVLNSLGRLKYPLPRSIYIYEKCINTDIPQNTLGRDLGIDPSVVNRIRNGKAWCSFRIFYDQFEQSGALYAINNSN